MKRTLILIGAAIGAIIVSTIIFVTVARIISPEDTWIKDSNGVWIKHGNPIGGPPTR